ncbi:MAG TPA: nuclear transport factor 2 family protein [Actinomycetota bacterium]|nr:nuclear transport factor 2 family protein [Actinomycetota bacterium]
MNETLAAVEHFNEAFNSHDVDRIMSLMTDDVVFESTSPAPDGQRFEGQAAVSAVWQELFSSTPDAYFESEEIFVGDDRAAIRWIYTFTDSNGSKQHVRGVDVIHVRNGKVAEKLSYVKG